MFLDKFLQPLTTFIPDLIIDSPHLLLLLQHVALQPDRKYILVTADINAMYLELPINVCKRNCLAFFNKHKYYTKFPMPITEQQLKSLLDLSLDYSFIEFNGELFYQHRGIQMGNSASVSVANITAAIELESIQSDLIVFRGRFIDDILLIVDVTDLEMSIDLWLESLFKHPFLKFSYEYSDKAVTFLDLNISLTEDNKISTSLYRKPMSKHEFLHFESNHPRHLLKSLPYSCGLRVIRSCTDETDKINELNILMDKFQSRGYPNNILNQAMDKLQNIDRKTLLTPKSNILIQHLAIHNTDILNLYDNSHQVVAKIRAQNTVFIVMPFYKSIHGMGKIIKQAFFCELYKTRSRAFRKCIVDLNICISFSVANSIQRYIQCVNEIP